MGILQRVVETVSDAAKGERPDGTRIAKVHPYRLMMTHIMRGRNESVVYFDTYARVDQLLKYLEEVNKHFHVDITHCLVAAASVGLAENPKMNRFVAGRRLYQRKKKWVTFSMKRQKLGREAKLSAVKLEMQDHETFRDLCDRINGHIKVERSDKKTYQDKEFDVLGKLPRLAMDGAVSLLKGLDYFGLLPIEFIEGDAMYTSMFIANLGSVGMAAGYHHLYEWGNAALFQMVGRIEERPLVIDGEVKVVPVMPIRWSYDERIDDGHNANYGILSVNRVLENPYEYLGCIKEDKSDYIPLARPAIR